MQDKFKNLPLRNGVGIVVLNEKNKVFVAKRIDNPKYHWQMPQGGVDKDEDFLKAAYRELKEETSIENIQVLKELDGWFEYELPKNLLGIIWKGKFRGQKQKWYIAKFKGENNEINLNTKFPEFIDWKWIEIEDLTKKVVDFKKKVYERLYFELKNFKH